MLHPTNLPKRADELKRVVELQAKLLETAARNGEIDQVTLEAEFGANVAKWVAAHNVKLGENLRAFAKHPTAQKQAVVTAIHQDQQWESKVTDASVRFTFNSAANGAASSAAIFLRAFYDAFGTDGFQTLLGAATASFQKSDWWRCYQDANPRRYMCAVCDGTMNHGITWDHYLPKEKYPPLSIHPYNLLPACDKCNNDKGSKDPLDARNLTQIFLPYQRFLRDWTRLEFVTSPTTREEIRLAPRSTAPEIVLQLATYAELYKIPEQWNRNLDEIAQVAIEKLRGRIEVLREQSVTMDGDCLRDSIDKVCADMERNWGVYHYWYPATEWLRWAKDNKWNSLVATCAV